MQGNGIYRTSNGGDTWEAANPQPANTSVTALVIKPNAGATLFAATDGGGVFTSSDSGASWSVCKDGSNVENSGLVDTNVISLTIATDPAGKLYAGTRAGVFVSSDDCATWTAISTGLPN